MTAMVLQCELRAPDGGRLVSWLPAEHAVPGRCLTLKADDGSRKPRMTVVRAYGMPLAAAWIRDRSRDWARTRQASDV